jgi:hypothetical protein
MNRTIILVFLVLIIGGFFYLILGPRPTSSDNPGNPFVRPKPKMTFGPRDLADSIYTVISTHQEIYHQNIIQRLVDEEKVVRASPNWKEEKALPVHSQVARMVAESIQSRGAEFSYTFRSLHPVNKRHAVETPLELTALEYQQKHPADNYYAEEMLGGRRYFTAIYPQRAIFQGCVNCHNRLPESPRHDYKTNDVLGALVIRVPLEL